MMHDDRSNYLTREQLLDMSGLSPDELRALEEARLLVPDTTDRMYRPKLVGWGRKLALLLAEGWKLDEIKRWAKGRWSTPNPREWPPNREQWRGPKDN
jgi:DNA-binding transcriptional MerR regulator